MPRKRKGPHLHLRPARYRDGKLHEAARWVIRDGRREFGTGSGAGCLEDAEKALRQYLAEKHEPARRERDLDQIRIADVIHIYVRDKEPTGPAIGRFERLLEFFGRKYLADVNGALCREYAASRKGKGQSNKGTGGGARRDLEDLRAAINHHAKEGLHRGVVRVVLPERGMARQRWLTRPELARLLWSCWRNRGPAGEWASRHLARFLIVGIYTGSRPGAILTAAWDRGPGRSWVDLDRGVFHRHPDGKVETNKRQPTVKIAPRLAAHLRRWCAADGGRGYVVTYDGLRIADPSDALARAVKRANLEGGVTAYTMRHSCASWLVAKGIPTRKVADFLGTSEEMILRHYGHLAPDYQDQAAIEIGRR